MKNVKELKPSLPIWSLIILNVFLTESALINYRVLYIFNIELQTLLDSSSRVKAN